MSLPMFLLAGLLAGPGPAAQEPPAQQPASETPSATADPMAADVHLEAGLRAFQRRRYVQAEAEFRKAVEANPDSAAAHFYLGYTYYKRVEPRRTNHPDKQKAAELFARAFELDPMFWPAWGPRPAPAATSAARP